MATIYGKNNAKAFIGGGGGASLNLAYGLTPPDDTSKIWIQTATEPTSVKVEANREIAISSSQEAKKVETDAIELTYQDYTNASYSGMHFLKMGDSYFFINTASSSSKFLNTDISATYIYVYKNGVVSKFIDESFNCSGRPAYLEKYDDTHFIFYFKYGSQSKVYAYIISAIDGTYDGYIQFSYGGYDFTKNMKYSNGKIYGFFNGSTNFRLYTMDLETQAITYDELTIPISNNSMTNTNMALAIYNGYAYFTLCDNTALTTSNTIVCKYKLDGSESVSKIIELNRITYGSNPYALGLFNYLQYENNLIITNIMLATSAQSGVYTNKVYMIDLANGTYQTLNIGDAFHSAFICVGNAQGSIEIWGGYPTTSNAYQKKVIYDIYSLAENTLELFYDTYFDKNIRIVNEETLIIDAPIDHAWLGDSNSIAQVVNMYYYNEATTTWKGINCADYSE